MKKRFWPLLHPVLFGQTYHRKVLNMFGSSIVAYWPLWEASGAAAPLDISGNGYNGAYGATTAKPTPGAAGIGDGHTSTSFDGGDLINVYSLGLAGAFSGVAGTLLAWGKVSGSGVWTDGTQRFIARLVADDNNYVFIDKRTTSNNLRVLYSAGGTAKGVTTTYSATGWFHYGVTWDKNAGASGQLKVYINGAQSGTTQTSLGTWAGTLSATNAAIGATGSGGGSNWSGWLAHVLLLDRAATSAEVAKVATV